MPLLGFCNFLLKWYYDQRVPTGGRLTSWLFTHNAVEEFNSRLPRKIQIAVGWTIWTGTSRFHIQRPKPLRHAASLISVAGTHFVHLDKETNCETEGNCFSQTHNQCWNPVYWIQRPAHKLLAHCAFHIKWTVQRKVSQVNLQWNITKCEEKDHKHCTNKIQNRKQ